MKQGTNSTIYDIPTSYQRPKSRVVSPCHYTVLVLDDNSIPFVACKEYTDTKEEVCSAESFHNQFIVRQGIQHKYRVLPVGERLWAALFRRKLGSWIQTSPHERCMGLQRRKYGGNMEILQQRKSGGSRGTKDLKQSSKRSGFISWPTKPQKPGLKAAILLFMASKHNCLEEQCVFTRAQLAWKHVVSYV
jgi:hypothetical protein